MNRSLELVDGDRGEESLSTKLKLISRFGDKNYKNNINKIKD